MLVPTERYTINLDLKPSIALSMANQEVVYSNSSWEQSGNDARLRTGGSKIEGWNTASHVVKILI